jgi:hypothetical protein
VFALVAFTSHGNLPHTTYSKARFILRREAMKALHFSQWEALKLRSLRNVILHPKYLVQGTTRKENDVESTFVLHGIKSAQFLSLPKF